ncbi:hypothetical protein SAMN04487897_12012 [Paenibacillus sp. yr247]|uniref:hypothetical protein n=1 Tax=Paenibacillus sp. yr247 TaxID=1761880 RepID=UPI00088F2442|nr:hypothetical protein [Paenibacillus sp. yr247]SDO70744.1 hypothetical protein SAMN04487897_12012 [Paenibacillus sp. yr247]
MVWSQWVLDRVIILMVGVAYLFIWVQVTLSHYRQNFHNKFMWGPVILALVISFVSIMSTLLNSKGWYTITHICFWLGVIQGLIGFLFHIKGVRKRVGGLALRNFLTGPPVMMPLLFSIISIFGLTAIYGG